MKTIHLLFLSLFLVFFAQVFTYADEAKEEKKYETVEKDGYTLKVYTEDSNFPMGIRKKVINTFFKVYPRLAKDFNPKTNKSVTINIQKIEGAPAYAVGGEIFINAEWLKNSKGNDVDIVTHEVMHIVQAYPGGPGWVTEGIADYVRFKYGVDNDGSGWELPDFSKDHKYTDAYRVTARFFYWIEKNVNPNAIKEMDKVMRSGKYKEKDESWKDITGKTIDELWEMYSKNPDKGFRKSRRS